MPLAFWHCACAPSQALEENVCKGSRRKWHGILFTRRCLGGKGRKTVKVALFYHHALRRGSSFVLNHVSNPESGSVPDVGGNASAMRVQHKLNRA